MQRVSDLFKLKKTRGKNFLSLDGRGSASIELALVTLFFFLPLVTGTADFMFIMAGRSQMAAAMRAVHIFAWSDPNDSTNADDINHLLALRAGTDVDSITLAEPPTLSFTCLQSDGSETSATVTFNSGYSQSDLSTAAATSGLNSKPVPSSTETIGSGIGTASCATGSVQAKVTYVLNDNVHIPVPLPKYGDTFPMTISSTIWVH